MLTKPFTDLHAEGVALLAAHFGEAPAHVPGLAHLFEVGGVKILTRASRVPQVSNGALSALVRSGLALRGAGAAPSGLVERL